jgi:hypothetical protein
MKNILIQNADVLGLNSLTIMISLTNVEQVLQIVALCVGIIYTLVKMQTTLKDGKKSTYKLPQKTESKKKGSSLKKQ